MIALVDVGATLGHAADLGKIRRSGGSAKTLEQLVEFANFGRAVSRTL
jgi:ribosomal protein L18E